MEKGDSSFIELITENKNLIFKVCNVYANSIEDRQDLYQDIVLQLWRSYPSFKKASKVSTWMYRVAINTAISTIRKKRPTSVNKESLEIIDADSQSSLRSDNEQLLSALINSLNKIEKSLILLYLEEKTYDEISDITGMSKSNVSVRLVRIKRKLAELYKTEKI